MSVEQIVLNEVNKINQLAPSEPISFDMLKNQLPNISEDDIADALNKLEQKKEIKVLTRNTLYGSSSINMFQKI